MDVIIEKPVPPYELRVFSADLFAKIFPYVSSALESKVLLDDIDKDSDGEGWTGALIVDDGHMGSSMNDICLLLEYTPTESGYILEFLPTNQNTGTTVQIHEAVNAYMQDVKMRHPIIKEWDFDDWYKNAA